MPESKATFSRADALAATGLTEADLAPEPTAESVLGDFSDPSFPSDEPELLARWVVVHAAGFRFVDYTPGASEQVDANTYRQSPPTYRAERQYGQAIQREVGNSLEQLLRACEWQVGLDKNRKAPAQPVIQTRGTPRVS